MEGWKGKGREGGIYRQDTPFPLNIHCQREVREFTDPGE
jgi:hypothetical protein